MHTIAITYDPSTREMSTTGGYAGTIIDNVSTQITVSGIPDGYTARLEFRVTVKDVNGRNVRPWRPLVNGTCILTDVILNACRRDNKLPTQLVLTQDEEVIASRNVITLNVAPAIDAWGSFIAAYRNIWDEAFVGVSQDTPGELSFDKINGSVETVDVDISTKPLPVGNLVGVIDPVHIPPVVFERCVVVPDDAARFALTTDDVQNGDTVKVTSTDLMYMVVDDTHLDSEEGYTVYRSLVPWGSISGDIEDQQDLQAQFHEKADVAEGVEPWRSALPYPSGAITKVGGSLYVALQDSTGHDPQDDDQSSPVYWRVYAPSSGEQVYQCVQTFTVGNGTDTEFILTHSFGSYDVFAFLYPDSGSRETCLASFERTNVNQIKVTFDIAPASNSYKVVVFRPGAGPDPVVNSVNGRNGVVTLSKTDVGLGNADNTADADKVVSGPQQVALDGKVDKIAGKGLSSNDYTTAEKEKLAGVELGAQVNDVMSVAGRTGDVVLTKTDVGLPNADNTSDANKPVSGPQQTELDKRAKWFNTTITGNGSLTSFTVTHNLGRFPTVQVRTSDGECVIPSISCTTTQLTLTFFSAPSSGEVFNIMVIA